jgi:hypothetical protein
VAVVQISRIQIRRGQKNTGTGLPQLASGELGWAIDSQELYIGNGAVSEGAPAVGNTSILTEHSNLFEFADSYTYESDSGVIQTGASSSSPIERSLQDRLDDIVSVKAFGCKGNGTDCTVELQRAIDQLFINSATKGTTPSRVVLYFEPGTYLVDGTIYVPPYATLRGAGADKTIIQQTTNASTFQTVNDSSTPGSPANDSTSTTLNQARFVEVTGMTLDTNGAEPALRLDSCADSKFEDLKILGTFSSGDTITDASIGIKLNALSTAVTCKNNVFKNIRISGFAYGIESKYDIVNNKFEDCNLQSLGYGVVFGKNISIGLPGQVTGPLHNSISTSYFYNIDRKGIWVNSGNYNVTVNNKFIQVGNEGGTESNASHSVIDFDDLYNVSDNDYFERTNDLSFNQLFITGVPFVPTIEGHTFSENSFTSQVNVGQQTTAIRLFRLPADANRIYKIEYWYRSDVYNALRSGVLNIVYDNATDSLAFSDDYDYVGDFAYRDRLKFNALTADENFDATNETLLVTVENAAIADNGVVQFKVTTIS